MKSRIVFDIENGKKYFRIMKIDQNFSFTDFCD